MIGWQVSMQSQLSLTEGVAVSQGRLYPELGSCSVPSSPVVFRAKTRSVSPNILQDSVRSVVKLREREGQRVDLGRSLKGHL